MKSAGRRDSCIHIPDSANEASVDRLLDFLHGQQHATCSLLIVPICLVSWVSDTADRLRQMRLGSLRLGRGQVRGFGGESIETA